MQRSRREPSPDRSDWTPDAGATAEALGSKPKDFADEQKEKADAAFKEAAYRDAIVYYTRALKHTPRNERWEIWGAIWERSEASIQSQ